MTTPDEHAFASLRDLLNYVEPDDWRTKNGFSPDITQLNEQLWKHSDTESARKLLLDWLGKSQPCLFGRVAARRGAISTCIIFEEQLRHSSDQELSDFIQLSREEWTREAFKGGSSGFVIFLLSETLAIAKPNETLFNFAKRLCELYLLRDDIEANRIYHDEIFLAANDRTQTTWKWLAGVNFFGACGDRRWWHDHRIPGGIALSVNSVGHLVKSRILAEANRDYSRSIGVSPEIEELGKIDSLDTALEWAMRTINNASNAVSGKATYLVPPTSDTGAPPPNLPRFLQEFEHRYYEGYYHTDFTLPSDYFTPIVERPHNHSIPLDLTYLTESGVANPDHILMGAGRRIRQDLETEARVRTSRIQPTEVPIAGEPRLATALGGGFLKTSTDGK
jgi:hypothetical protein